MDPFILKLDSPERCEQYARNIQVRDPKNAEIALRRAVELRAEQYHATSPAERECVQAVYAYERAMWKQRGKPVKASRTWQMIKRRGIIPAVEYIVNKPEEFPGYTILVEMGMRDMAFEAVVLRHPQHFSEQAIAASQLRLAHPLQ